MNFLKAIDRRLARRYAPHIKCPECGELVLVNHKLTIATDSAGSQSLNSEPELDALWNHWGSHAGLTK